jgi:hypothetical protein
MNDAIVAKGYVSVGGNLRKKDRYVDEIFVAMEGKFC